jgi:hypothetical protein
METGMDVGFLMEKEFRKYCQTVLCYLIFKGEKQLLEDSTNRPKLVVGGKHGR